MYEFVLPICTLSKLKMDLITQATSYFSWACVDGRWANPVGEQTPGHGLHVSFDLCLVSLHRRLHAHLGSLLLLPVFWQQRVCDDWLAMPVLWDQHRGVECSGCYHGGAVSHQPEVGSSPDFTLGLVCVSLVRNLLPAESRNTRSIGLHGVHVPNVSWGNRFSFRDGDRGLEPGQARVRGKNQRSRVR